MENREVARVLRETAQLLEIDGAIIGRYRSYEKAAELIASLAESIEAIARDPEKLEELPGIGERMAEHIREILSTGDYALRKKLLKKYPLTMLELLTLQSLGPKKALILWREFKCCTVEQLEQLAREGKLRDLAGFGEKTEQNILKAIEVYKKISGRFLIPVAEQETAKLIAYIQRYGRPIASITPAGSLRRWKETIGDLDLLLTLSPETQPKELEAIKEHILGYGELEQVLARGENKVSFRVAKGLQVDVRLLQPENYGAALIYFTGSKEHNVSLRGRAIKMGYTLNEYALATLKEERRVAGASEEEVYAKLKLDFIPPELRENCGEIEAAEQHRLPRLIEQSDLHGDLQMHTTASDGRHSIEEMARAARKMGYEYIAITDHSKAVTVANGMDEARTREHMREIRTAKVDGIRVLAGIEVDILKDGRLDLPDEVLAELDIVVASIHSFMNLDRAAITERMLAAIENPYVQIIGHPTGRILLRRDAMAYDMERILDAARRRGVAMECNAAPDRLDLKDAYLRMAKERGVRVVISTDAHSIANLQLMRYGVQMARRGWIEKKDVLNALPLEQMLAALRPKPSGAASKKAVAAPHS
ncbi:MAG: DNA polymerase/3'-5' exonuclease PolX [Acidobacteria bacterium]|nr:MAG: DNA polymerase/3'-5' exonuclease PolX [Acidobacteriota bacterium]